MPLNIDILQILLHMLNFVILTGGLTFLLFKPVTKFLDERREHYEKLARDNEEQAKENARVKAEYEQKFSDANAEIAAMRAEAEKSMADISKAYISDARDKANSIIAAAENDAEKHKEHIMDTLQTEIGELVVSAAQKLLSDAVPNRDVRDAALYDEFIRVADQTVKDKRASK